MRICENEKCFWFVVARLLFALILMMLGLAHSTHKDNAPSRRGQFELLHTFSAWFHFNPYAHRADGVQIGGVYPQDNLWAGGH